MKFETERMLVVSTAHITQDDSKILDDLACYDSDGACTDPPALIVYKNEYWFLVCVRNGPSNGASVSWLKALRLKLSTACQNWMIKAVQHNCNWIKFDRDGEVYEGFPTFEWQNGG
jgi:hypothetical protein